MHLQTRQYVSADVMGANVVLGSPKRDCRHLGICRIDPENNPANSYSSACRPSVHAYLNIDSNGRLQCSFNTGELTSAQREKHFGQDYFVISDELTLTETLTEAMGGVGVMVIDPGKYPVMEYRGRMLVSLRLRRAAYICATPHLQGALVAAG